MSKNLIIVLLIILLLLSFYKEPSIEYYDRIVTKEIVKHDTIIISHIDTLTIIKDSVVYLPDSSKIYTSVFEDNYIRLRLNSRINGSLLNQNFKYDLKLPVTNTIKYIKDKRTIYSVGLDASIHQISPLVEITTKQGYNIGMRYEYNFTHNYRALALKASFPIYKSKN